ncbi:MAG TPA: hypothetical protein VF899_17390 [Pyrinomonadaceae bacterium]
MRTLLLCILFLFCSVTARSQSTNTPHRLPDVIVVKYSWTKERIAWERDPFSGTNESFGDMRQRASDDKRRERAVALGNIGEANRIEREARAEQVIKSRPPAPPRYAFIYKVSVKNIGAKTIKELDWDYIFFDSATEQEIGRHQFASTENIGPGKSKELSFFNPSPPTKTISIYALDKKERVNLGEAVVLVRIEYADGSFWQSP